MKLCDEIITVFNAKLNTATDKDEYHATVITGVSWFCEIVSAVDNGLKATNKFIIRIPEDADFDGKTYVTPLQYAEEAFIDDLFTLKNGDIIVRGAVTDTDLRPADLHRNYEAFTILGVTDNRRDVRSPHWKVIGS